MLFKILLTVGGLLSLAGTFVFGWLYLKEAQLTTELVQGMKKDFNSELSSVRVQMDHSGLLIEKLSVDLPEDIKREVERQGAEYIQIAGGRFSNQYQGGGNLNPVNRIGSGAVSGGVSSTSGNVAGSSSGVGADGSSSVGTVSTVDVSLNPCEWKFQDWQLTASVKAACGSPGQFDYSLNQQFSLVMTSTDKGQSFVRLYQLDKDGALMQPPLKTEELFNVVLDKPLENEFRWAPHVDVGLGMSLGGEVGAELGVSLIGYGKTENDLSWRFIRGGGFYNGSYGGLLCPASYNIGGPLPLLSNAWVSPCYLFDGGHSAFVGIEAVL